VRSLQPRHLGTGGLEPHPQEDGGSEGDGEDDVAQPVERLRIGAQQADGTHLGATGDQEDRDAGKDGDRQLCRNAMPPRPSFCGFLCGVAV
jgi:hypothetical protein